MSLYLYGVVRGCERIAFGPIGFNGGEVSAIPYGSLAALVGTSPREEFHHLPKEELVALLLAHQQTLETVMKQFFVLPFKFGTLMKDEAELAGVLGKGQPLLQKMIDRFQGATEIDLVATWEVHKVLQQISEEDPEITVCKGEAHAEGERARVGRLLAEALKRRAQVLREKITKTLTAHSTAHADHDLFNDEMVLNTSFLICRDREKEFFQAVEEINRLFEDQLHFKCVGPLPPYSFSTVSLKRFDPREIEEAARALGLGRLAEPNQVKKTYKALSRRLHPDTNPTVPLSQLEHINKAYQLMADYCREGARSLSAEAVVAYVRLDTLSCEEWV